MRSRKDKPSVKVVNHQTGRGEVPMAHMTIALFANYDKQILEIIKRYDRRGTANTITGRIVKLTGMTANTVRRYLMYRGWTERYRPPSVAPKPVAAKPVAEFYDHAKVKQMMEDFVSLLAVAELMAEKLREYEKLVADRYSKEEATP